ncbi:hypothetical protein C0J52_08318 [Blattella germanica]|nr:hypothetical protein C0J52_08318 [Blattella germanica]
MLELAKENIAKRIPQNSLKKILQKKTMELSRAEKRENGSKICRQNCKGGKSANECNSCKKTLCNKCIGKKKEEEEEKREFFGTNASVLSYNNVGRFHFYRGLLTSIPSLRGHDLAVPATVRAQSPLLDGSGKSALAKESRNVFQAGADNVDKY